MPRKQEAVMVCAAVHSGPSDEAGGGAVRNSRVAKSITRPAEILSRFGDGDRTVARVRPSSMLVVCAALGLGMCCCFPATAEAQVPTVTTLPASNVNLTGARLQGTVNANGLAAKAWFEWGTTTNYGSNTLPVSLPGTGTPQGVTNALAGLMSGVAYHFRLVASNSVGIARGSDRGFNTRAFFSTERFQTRVPSTPQHC